MGAVLSVGCGLVLHTYKVGKGLADLSYALLLVGRGDLVQHSAVIVYLDEISHLKLAQPGNAPWDRALHAKLVDRLTRAGAKAIAFDIVFNSPNPANPDGDARLVESVRKSGRVVLAADNIRISDTAKQIELPFPDLADAAAGIGSAEVIPDPDLLVRVHTPEEQIPSLSWVAAEVTAVEATRQESVRKAKRWMHYYGPPNSVAWCSYFQALDPAAIPDEFFAGKTVFVGARMLTRFSGERKDEYRNPFSFWLSEKMAREQQALFMAGVEVQATAFLNLSRNDWLRRLSPAAERWVVILCGLVFGCLLLRFHPAVGAVVAVGGAALAALVSYQMFGARLTWFPWLIVVAQILVALGWSVLFNSVQLYVQKRLYQHTLGLYLSPKLVKKFASKPTLLRPGAEKQILTLFFSDIAGFTSISEGMDSDELAALMNAYFQTAVSDCIHATEGTVVKYIGDSIFAFWNAPDAQPDHAVRACKAALLFRELSRKPIRGLYLRTRIGLHGGVANVGNFGSNERVDYTALGENVNLASRLEGLNKYLGTSCLISGTTCAEIGDQLVTRHLGSFQLKGFENPVAVHELVGWPADAGAARPWCETFALALDHYQRRDRETAERLFRRVIEMRGDDGPSSFYLQQIDELSGETAKEDSIRFTVIKEK